MRRSSMVLASLLLGACASAPRGWSETLARMPVAQPEEPARPEEYLARRTLASAIAAGEVPTERPLVLMKSPFGNARILPRAAGAKFVILEGAEMRRLASQYGTFPFLYLRIDAPEGKFGRRIIQDGIDESETRVNVMLFTTLATPPSADGEIEVMQCCFGHKATYEKHDGIWVLTSSGRFEI